MRRRIGFLAAFSVFVLPALALAGVLQAAPPAGGMTGQFNTPCNFSHRAPVDPIVAPGLRNGSHMHDFLGNRSTDHRSTLESLRRSPALCLRPGDRSAYWVPTLSQMGRTLTPARGNFYYRTAGRDPERIVPFPHGLRVVAGSSKSARRQARSVTAWTCVPRRAGERMLDEGRLERAHRRAIRRAQRSAARHRRALRRGAPEPARHRRALRRLARRVNARRALLRPSPGVPHCPSGEMLRLAVHFPDCWDGKSLDSFDHASHLAYSSRMRNGRRTCPATHPAPVPRLSVDVRYTTRGGRGLALSSGSTNTAHADFFNAWDERALADLVERCLKADRRCGTR